MDRCTDPDLGVKVLSYDLLAGEEKAEVEAHLAQCAACRDLLHQTFGKEGALDELASRVYRLGQRRPVEARALLAERLRNLWLPFIVFALVLGVVGLFLGRRGTEVQTVGLRRLALGRAGSIDSLFLSPQIDPTVTTLFVRPDRPARAYVYESHSGRLQRLLPPADREPPGLSPDSTSELPLPPLQGSGSRLLLVLVPRDAPGTTLAWDAAILTRLSGRPRAESEPATGPWPEGARPMLRWVP